MEDCLFCKIIDGTIPSQKVYEDELVLAFKDINPQAPVHILLIPKKHIPSWAAIVTEEDSLLAYLMKMAAIIAEKEGLTEGGYRIVSNCGPDAGQTVPHLHLHILGGAKLGLTMA